MELPQPTLRIGPQLKRVRAQPDIERRVSKRKRPRRASHHLNTIVHPVAAACSLLPHHQGRVNTHDKAMANTIRGGDKAKPGAGTDFHDVLPGLQVERVNDLDGQAVACAAHDPAADPAQKPARPQERITEGAGHRPDSTHAVMRRQPVNASIPGPCRGCEAR